MLRTTLPFDPGCEDRHDVDAEVPPAGVEIQVRGQPPNSLIAYHNQYTANNWLKFQTRGRRSNRDGLGTRITLHAGGLTQRQYVRSGAGFRVAFWLAICIVSTALFASFAAMDLRVGDWQAKADYER